MKNFKSKEQIKSSMIRKAATMWGVQPTEIESSFDPVINLLITACAAEIEKLHTELKGSQNIITEKLIELMTPEAVVGSQAAHGILYAFPTENQLIVNPDFQFYHRKKSMRSNASSQSQNIFFSALSKFKIINANIQYLITYDHFISYNNHLDIEISKPRSIGNLELASNVAYVGINFKNDLNQILNSPIYFEIHNNSKSELFYNYLKQSRWFIGENELNIRFGLDRVNDSEEIELNQFFSTVSNKSDSVYNKLKYFYSRNYVQVTNTNGATLKDGNQHLKLQRFLEENEIETGNNFTWIKIVFPEAIDSTLLKSIHCTFNAMPILNRRLINLTYTLKKHINIIPLMTEDFFFDLKALSNTEGKNYSMMSNDLNNSTKGTFMLRSGSVGKLDKRSAKEYLTYLIELLKDESAAFSFLNSEFLSKNVKSLNQLISALEKKVKETSSQTEQKDFLMLVPYKEEETVLIEYWTTQGEIANQLKIGSAMALYKGTGVSTSNCYLLTSTLGGKNSLTQNERIYAYRRSLLSRDRIVTKEDIKALCFDIYGDHITLVKVEKKHIPSSELSKNLVLSILIQLYPNSSQKTTLKEWELLNAQVLFMLEKKSLNIYPYQIKIVN